MRLMDGHFEFGSRLVSYKAVTILMNESHLIPVHLLSSAAKFLIGIVCKSFTEYHSYRKREIGKKGAY